MSSGCLTLRSDLVVSQRGTPAGTVSVVKDPATGRFFSLREAEHFIAQQLDGSTPLDVIRQRVGEKFGSSLPRGTLEQFIETLRRLGLLEAQGGEAGHPACRPGRVFGNLLYLRLKAFDPDRLFDRLLGHVGFFFTAQFLLLSSALIFIAIGVTIVNSEEIGRDFFRLFQVQALFLTWVTILLVTAAHEFAHGLTCKRFGGEVHEVGFFLLFFIPAFYCNVSDAWLFPEKSKRLWVTFAGAYFEIFLWAVATLTWRVTDPETVLNHLALVVMATSGIRSVLHLNPLIKLDGYYLLSDLLEIPNLKRRALSYLGARIRQFWGTAIPATHGITAREQRIYLIYGLLAGAYSFSLLGFFALRLGSFLIERYQGVGVVLFGAILVTLLRHPLGRVPRRIGVLFRTWLVAPLRRTAKILVLGAAVLLVLVLARMELTVSGEFKVLPSQNADARAEVEGIVEEVLVEEGDLVKQGQLIARLADRDYRAELQKVHAEQDEKRAKLRMLKQGPRQEEITRVRREVETAKTRHEHARNRYGEARRVQSEQRIKAETAVEKAKERLRYGGDVLEMYRTLYQKELVARLQVIEADEQVAIRKKELEETQAELNRVLADELAEVKQVVAVTEKELREAEARLAVLLAGSRPEEIEANEAEAARVEAQRRQLEEQLRLTSLMSPMAGVITTPKLREKVGQYVKKGDLIVQVNELRTVKAEIPISEKEIADVKVGQQVMLRARAYPEQSFSGIVSAIAPAAAVEEQGARGKVVRVTTEIENAALLLKPEMTGNAKIYCGKQPIIDLLTRRIARYVRVEFWSWW